MPGSPAPAQQALPSPPSLLLFPSQCAETHASPVSSLWSHSGPFEETPGHLQFFCWHLRFHWVDVSEIFFGSLNPLGEASSRSFALSVNNTARGLSCLRFSAATPPWRPGQGAQRRTEEPPASSTAQGCRTFCKGPEVKCCWLSRTASVPTNQLCQKSQEHVNKRTGVARTPTSGGRVDEARRSDYCEAGSCARMPFGELVPAHPPPLTFAAV